MPVMTLLDAVRFLIQKLTELGQVIWLRVRAQSSPTPSAKYASIENVPYKSYVPSSMASAKDASPKLPALPERDPLRLAGLCLDAPEPPEGPDKADSCS